ncbi:MAG: SH3 domain-containing protein, partial [Thermoflexales bacterium]
MTKARSVFLAVAIGVAMAFSGATPILASSTSAAGVASPLENVIVTVAALNVRSGPSTNATILGGLQGGARVSTTGKSEDGLWWKISFNGEPAFIYAEYATVGGSFAPDQSPAAPASGAVSVAVPALNVRAAPGLSGEVIGLLAGGTTLTPRGRSTDGGWFKIDYVGATGWIYAALTSAPGAAGAAPAAPAAPRPAAPAAAPGRFGGFELGGHINS